MIQRIQTLYLFITVFLMGLMLLMPLGTFMGGGESLELRAFGFEDPGQAGERIATPWLGVLVVIAALMPLVLIFLYKHRLLQWRLCFMEMIFLAGVQIFVVIYLWNTTLAVSSLEAHSVAYSPADVFPLIGMISIWLAMRAILKDERLVRSLDRLR